MHQSLLGRRKEAEKKQFFAAEEAYVYTKRHVLQSNHPNPAIAGTCWNHIMRRLARSFLLGWFVGESSPISFMDITYFFFEMWKAMHTAIVALQARKLAGSKGADEDPLKAALSLDHFQS